MGTIAPVSRPVHGDSSLIVRIAEESDAEALHALLGESFATSDFLVTLPAEWSNDVSETRRRIIEHRDSSNQIMLLAEFDGQLIGELTFHANRRQRMSHHGQFGLSVAAAWRGRGVGRALILTLLDWAAAHPTIEKVRLGVFASNTRAHSLYTRLGFVEECRQRDFFKLGPGQYVDDILMALYVKPGLAPHGFNTHTPGAVPRI